MASASGCAGRRRRSRLALLVVVVVLGCGALTTGSGAGAAAPSSTTVWLCRPGAAHDPCLTGLTTTVVRADGTRTVERVVPPASPPIDCFYVYPTVSGQPTTNADLTVDPEEVSVAKSQAARFSSVCRVYAPMYRQLTISAILGRTGSIGAGAAIAYADVLAAWRDYLAHDNHGRGVVLIGHSQGAAILVALLQREVDPDAAVRRRVVSAILLGGNVTVAAGTDVGGDFQHLPACHSAGQTGCVVAYSSFDHAPPPNSLFGRPGLGVSNLVTRRATTVPLQVLCVNPASLGGGSGALQPYFTTRALAGPLRSLTRPPTALSTPWVTFPGLYTARCEQQNGASWLQVDDVGGPNDHRVRVSDALGPTWGLHLVDVNVALGNLVDVVRHEAAAYRR